MLATSACSDDTNPAGPTTSTTDAGAAGAAGGGAAGAAGGGGASGGATTSGGAGQGGDLPPPDIVWSADHETGDISQWSPSGGFIQQGPTASYEVVSSHAHTGSYGVGLTINTDDSSPTGAHAAYLFRWEDLPDDAYYYSAWYYLPQGVQPGDWWNVFQWKSTRDNQASNDPMFVLDVHPSTAVGLELVGFWRANDTTLRIRYDQPDGQELAVPTEQWFHLEGYYRRAQDDTGQIIIWQDGVEVFHVDGIQTVQNDNTVHWSINNYAADIAPKPLTIFVDDAIISRTRVGPNYELY
jgi:hypothetical protein